MTDVDYIKLNEEQRTDIERLAALGYTPTQMALYLDLPAYEFLHDAVTAGCTAYYHINRGKLVIKANADQQLLMAAEKGNITAIQQLEKNRRSQRYHEVKNQIDDNEI